MDDATHYEQRAIEALERADREKLPNARRKHLGRR